MQRWDKGRISNRHNNGGFTMVELLVTIAVVLIMAAAAAPLAQGALTQFRLKAAVTNITGAIQSTRFQAISSGYKFKLAIDNKKHTYQISSDANGTGTYKNEGGAVAFASGSLPVDMGSDVTLLLSPSGKVSFVTGSSPLVLKVKGKTSTITVSTYGNIGVKYGS